MKNIPDSIVVEKATAKKVLGAALVVLGIISIFIVAKNVNHKRERRELKKDLKSAHEEIGGLKFELEDEMGRCDRAYSEVNLLEEMNGKQHELLMKFAEGRSPIPAQAAVVS